MHPRILAGRQATATARMMKAARKLARHHGLGKEAKALEGASARLPAVQMMMQSEAMADLLEAITAKMGDMAEALDDSAAAEAEKPIGKDRKPKDG